MMRALAKALVYVKLQLSARGRPVQLSKLHNVDDDDALNT